MLNTGKNKLKLLGRNEGQIKSYESCFDLRAWSHDIHARDRYLRDWMRSDMPICVVPVCTVASFLTMMTWRRSKRVTPKCHTDCKSKIVLDSICNSCQSIKECLKNEEPFNKYFVEVSNQSSEFNFFNDILTGMFCQEEFETTHWPCDRCLEALKSIKMFWKIILEKIFNINIPKSESSACSNESIKTIARIWQSEIMEQTIVVKTLSPILINQSLVTKEILQIDKDTETDKCKDLKRKRSSKCLRKLSRCTSVKIVTVDVSCNTCNCDVEIKDSKTDSLQQRFNMQRKELKQLKKENATLKLKLESMCSNYCSTYSPLLISDDNNVAAPLPYEACTDDDNNIAKDIDSEMVISLKSFKNKNFRHVSMFQVLHKTNTLIPDDDISINGRRKKEDPVEILTKVQNTFGAILEKELKIATKDKLRVRRRDININASYQELNTNKSNVPYPQVSKSSHSTLSNSIFLSTTEVL